MAFLGTNILKMNKKTNNMSTIYNGKLEQVKVIVPFVGVLMSL